ncbi:hypothetical protein [uncultured Fibrobacter sp.]|uniref:hypothetical protein n=1 Tax=uncultured Fibrobacter sp. TaxID=261512 RepID=UPI0026388BB3|nr:hypothetical protein [uncultured Fibrobacter sp.]
MENNQKIVNRSPIITALQEQTDIYQNTLDNLTKKLRNAPKETLRVQPHKKSFQYYIVTQKGDTKGSYLPRKEIRKAKAIAQRDYNEAAAAIIKKQLAAIDTFLRAYQPNALDQAFTGLHPGRRALVTPVREPDDEFIAAWLHHPYTGKPFEINAPEFYTSTGVRVRSKSEVIIADALSRAGIPFRYEYPTSVKGWGTLYPDFTCLDTRTREEIIWEHFGLMGDPDYTESTVQKIAHYTASGYTLGKNFIATFENAASPLSVKQVQAYIKSLLM